MNKAIYKDILRLSFHWNEYLLEELPVKLAQASTRRARDWKEALHEFYSEEFGDDVSGSDEKKDTIKID
jgi:hypothetical protein